jgi:arabinofuranosyltransferase
MRGLAGGLLAVACAALLYGAVKTWPRTVDDAFITFRYGKNLAEGAGPVFNPGERVEGTSSPSWMVLSAGAIRLGADPVPLLKAAGVAASLALLFVLHFALRRAGVPPLGAGAATLLLGASLVLQIWAAAGMETNAYALVFFAGLVLLSAPEPSAGGFAAASAVLVLAALTRPEGLVVWGAGAGVVLLRAGTGRERMRALLAYGAPGLALSAFFAWRIGYYGAPLPNTYYVKTGGGLALWKQGLTGLRLFLTSPAHLPWLAAAALGTVAGLRRRETRAATAILAGACALHLLWVVSVGDDGLRVHRFYPPVLAPLAFLAGLLFRGPRPAVLTGAAAVALSVPLSLQALHAEVAPDLVYQEGNERLGRLLRETTPPGTRVAVAAAGAIPYYSGLPCIDMYGLNDAHIAREPFPETRSGRLMKWDNAYVLAQRPEMIAINRGYFRAGDPMLPEVARRPGLLAAGPMDRDLFRRVAEDGGYALRPLRFPDGSVFFVFERLDEVSAR